MFVESLEPLDKMVIYQVFNLICHPRENFGRKRKNLTVFDELVAYLILVRALSDHHSKQSRDRHRQGDALPDICV